MEYFILIIFSLTLYLISKKINTFIFHQADNILINTFIFSYFFIFIYLIFSYFFIFGLNGETVAYVIFFLISLYSFLLRHEIISLIRNFKFKIIKNNKILFLAVGLYFLLILFPAYDQDSLRYHLAIAKKINNNTFYLNTWIDYLVIGAHEFINSFSLHLNFEKISSYSNFIFLIFIILSNYYILKKYKVGSGILSGFILLASPYLLTLIASQKFFLMPCYIVSYSLAYLFLNKKNLDIKILHLLLFLNIFCVIIKPIFIFYLALVGLWSLYKINNYKNKAIYFFSGIIFTIICYAPLYIIKLKIYNDPFLVFFSINQDNFDWFYKYREFVSGIRFDMSDMIDSPILVFFLTPLKLVMPLHYSDIPKTLGFGFLFIFSINFKKHKNIFYLIALFVVGIIAMQTIQNRWFLPLLIFISIFSDIEKFKYLFKFLKLQVLCLILVLIPLSSLTFLHSFNLIDKKIILDNFLSQYQIIEKINKKYKNKKIFSSLNNFYHFDNVVPIYYPDVVNKFDKDFYKRNENDTKLILWRESRYHEGKGIEFFTTTLEYFVNKNLTCKKYEKIEEFRYNSRRLFPPIIKKVIMSMGAKNHGGEVMINLYKFNC
ncbi:MAG: hypothetical protein H8E55_09755 [Pelagibacterales bacterium]|nr:hypothetical protein [Pelagibacterales bacterium]